MFKAIIKHDLDIDSPLNDDVTSSAKEKRRYSFSRKRTFSPSRIHLLETTSDSHNSTFKLHQKQQKATRQDSAVSDIKYEKHVEGSFKCVCNVCKAQRKLQMKKEFEKSNKALDFFHGFDFKQDIKTNLSEKDFVFILKRLIPPKPLPYTLRLFIPETVAIINGEVSFITLTEKDKKLRFIRNKERLTPAEIRKFFQEYQKRNENELLLFDEKESQSKQKSEPKDILVTESSDVKDDTAVMDSTSVVKPKQKMRSVIHETASGRSMTKLVGLVKFKDGKEYITLDIKCLDTTTVLTEVELDSILIKRKYDPFWNKIQYLQIYIVTQRGINTLQRVYFVYERDRYDPLFERSLREIRFLNGDIPKASLDYIPVHDEEIFEKELAQTDVQKYYLYLLMKVFHFLDVIWGIRILKMGGDFVTDPLGTIWLMNISRVQYQNLNPEDEVYEEKSEEIEQESKEQNNMNPDDVCQNQKLIRIHPKGIGKYDALKVMKRVMRPQREQNVNTEASNEAEKGSQGPQENVGNVPLGATIKFSQIKQSHLTLNTTEEGSMYTYTPQKSRESKQSLGQGPNFRVLTAKSSHGDRSKTGLRERRQTQTPMQFYYKRGHSISKGNDGRSMDMESNISPISGIPQKHTEMSLDTSTISRRPQTGHLWSQVQSNVLKTGQHSRGGSQDVEGDMYGTLKERRRLKTLSSVETQQFQEKIVETKIQNVRRLELQDLSRLTVEKKNHSDWIKKLNNKIRERITSQLNNIYLATEPE